MKMASISVLTEDAILYVLSHLDIQDRISFAYTCERFRQICLNGKVLRNIDLSRCPVIRQKCAIKEFLRDKEMAKHIRELNLSNHSMQNWWTDIDIEEFIASCPQLQALHVLHSEISLKSAICILQRATKLTALSLSIIDLLPEDVDFLMRGNEFVCFENIKHLRFEIPVSATHINIVKYLVLTCCKYLEDLEVCICDLPWTSKLDTNDMNKLLYGQCAVGMEPLQYFHNLTVQTVFDPECSDSCTHELVKLELYYFILSVAEKKSRRTKWKRFLISQPLDTTVLLDDSVFGEFDSLEAYSANDEFNEEQLKTLFRRTKDGAVIKLQLHNVQFFDEFPEFIARIGGDALQCLSVSHIHKFQEMDMDANSGFNRVFTSCTNIRDLDLIGCHFRVNMCEPFSKLKHLRKVQLQQCAIFSHRDEVQENEANAELLKFVQHCQHVKAFDVRGCKNEICELSNFLADSQLYPVAKWTKLESLTCIDVSGRCNFLWKIKEHCKFLSMLRISLPESQDLSYLPILECAMILKHLAIQVPQAHLGSESFWMSLSHATSLQRLCIRSWYQGSVNVSAALEVIKSLPRLHVLHLHLLEIENPKSFSEGVIETLEKLDRVSDFELVIEEMGVASMHYFTNKRVLPRNVGELCFKSSGIFE